jgi:predicted MPP superfamily phosphohydrolase
MTVLGNEHRVLSRGGGKFTLAGVHDLHAARHIAAHVSDPNRAADGAPEGLRILLAHQPRSAAEAGETDAYDLQLSGHTHGGQYAPFQLMVWLAQPYLAGLHQVSERMQLYVSRGSGYWGPPIRAGAASEITKIVLTRAATA